jgi:glycosyltransferase involved in cell wall biosynthesis
MALKDPHVKIILNTRNFGFTRSTFYGLTQAEGDCAILLFADMQDPPELIPEFLKYWSAGNQIVIGIKSKSRENKLLYFIRRCYYWFVKKVSDIDHIEQFDGFGLYDKSFIKVLKNLDDPLPYLRGIVSELGYKRKDVVYTQDRRKKGKTSFNFFKLYDLAMLGITSYSKAIMRAVTLFGFVLSILSIIIALITFISKLIYWDTYPIGTAAIGVGIFFFGSIQLVSVGLLGEYIMNINTRVMHRPLVVEEKRINFKNSLE